MLLRIAARNIFRSKRRSIITMGAMVFALAAMIAYSALWDGMLDEMKRNASLMVIGQFQIHAPGYLKKADLYSMVNDPADVVKKLEANGFTAAQRLRAGGLAASKNLSSGVMLWGVEPDAERKAVMMPSHMMSGEWLSTADPKGIVVGKALARSLKLGLGSEVILVTQAADGTTANEIFRVRGIMQPITEDINKAGFFMTIDKFRQFMVMPSGAHEIAVKMGNGMDMQKGEALIKKAFPGLDVRSWKEIDPAIADLIELSKAFQMPIIAIIYIAVAIIILNAMLMAVFERMREYGIIKAIGMKPMKVFGLVAMEALVMTSISALLGCAIGVPLALYLQSRGISIGTGGADMSMSGIAIDPVWRASFSAHNVLMPVAVLVILCGIAAIYPAVKAARIKPVRGMTYS